MTKSQPKPPFLSVIIPSYNESKNFRDGRLANILPFLENQGYSYELIFSDDGSTDDTRRLLENFIKTSQPTLKNGTMTLLKNPHGGKTRAVSSGMSAAGGDWRLFTDFDQSTDIKELKKLLPFTDKGFDIIFGSRKLNKKDVDAKWYREFVGNSFNLIVRKLLGLKIKDTQCGFKLLSARAASLFSDLIVYSPKNSIPGAFTGAFDVELFVLADNRGLKYKEVPISWQHRPTNRVHILKDSARMFRDVLKIRKNKVSSRYKTV